MPQKFDIYKEVMEALSTPERIAWADKCQEQQRSVIAEASMPYTVISRELAVFTPNTDNKDNEGNTHNPQA